MSGEATRVSRTGMIAAFALAAGSLGLILHGYTHPASGVFEHSRYEENDNLFHNYAKNLLVEGIGTVKTDPAELIRSDVRDALLQTLRTKHAKPCTLWRLYTPERSDFNRHQVWTESVCGQSNVIFELVFDYTDAVKDWRVVEINQAPKFPQPEPFRRHPMPEPPPTPADAGPSDEFLRTTAWRTEKFIDAVNRGDKNQIDSYLTAGRETQIMATLWPKESGPCKPVRSVTASPIVPRQRRITVQVECGSKLRTFDFNYELNKGSQIWGLTELRETDRWEPIDPVVIYSNFTRPN